MTRRAICIGVAEYQDDTFESLPHCLNDAHAMGKLLSSSNGGFEVTLVENPTGAEMKHAVWKVLENSLANDEILIYFSGHGKRTLSRKLCLCGKDTYQSRYLVESVHFEQLIEILRECNQKSVFFVLDCCFSGAAEKSMLAKSGNELVSTSAKEMLVDRGWGVLASSGSFSPSWAYHESDLSEFTGTFIKVTKILSQGNTSWVTAANIYEALKFELLRQKPRLMGENALFPVLRGKLDGAVNAEQTLNTNLITQQEWVGNYPLFVGILVLPNFRAWLTIFPDELLPSGVEHLGDKITILHNKDEIFTSKVELAKQNIEKNSTILHQLSESWGARITLIHPVSIDEGTFLRFSGTDRKYVLKSNATLETNSFPVINRANISAIALGDKKWKIFDLPDDYRREAFGIIVEPGTADQDDIIIVKEDTLSRNAKYIAIQKSLNLFTGFATVNQNREMHFTQVSEFADSKKHLNLAYEKRRKQFYHGRSTEKVDTKIQKRKRKNQEVVECLECMDEKEVIFEENLRKYQVPCPVCNASANKSWMAFYRK